MERHLKVPQQSYLLYKSIDCQKARFETSKKLLEARIKRTSSLFFPKYYCELNFIEYY